LTLYVVRHGQTDLNANNCLIGRINSPLNEEGIKQAAYVAKKFVNLDIDLIVSSPLDRCMKTSEIISNNKIPIISSDKLLGRDHGEFTGVHRESINFNDYWNYNKNIKYEKAESVRDLYNRVASLIEELKIKYKDKNIIIVTHSGVMRVLYYYFKGIPKEGILGEITIKNCEVYEYTL
jgi:broad specificity phosphatase PhoE